MTFDSELGDFLTSINRAETVEGIWGHCVAFMADHGATHLNVTIDVNSTEPSLFSTMPNVMKERFLEELKADRDPTIAHFRNSTAPCFAGSEFEVYNDELLDERREFLEAACAHDVHSAMVFPVRLDPQRSLSKFGFNTGLRGSELVRVHVEYGNSIHLSAIAVTERIAKLLDASRKKAVKLTSRECECLLWLAKGLRNDRIADRLNVSGVTIEFHISNACRKLQARTRGQALVRAIQLGVLTP